MKDGGSSVAVSDATRTKVTKNTGLKKGVDQPISNMLDITLGAPQRQLVKMVTGKEQSPSEAMDITNPYGAFAADAILDPTNLVGAGLLGKAAKASTKTGVLSKAYKINPWAFEPNPGSAYRMIGGKEGYLDAINSGEIRAMENGVHGDAHFNMGMPLNPNRLSSEELLKAGSPGGYKGPYMVERKWADTGWNKRTMIDGFKNNPELLQALKDLGKDKDVWGKYGNLKTNDNAVKLYKEHWLQGYKEVPKKENGGWLEKYNDGGPIQSNYNDYSVSAPEGFEGDGYSNVGRNYSPAWGGQFKNGGKICDSCQKAEDGDKLSARRKAVLAKAEQVFNSKDLPYTIPEDIVKSGGNSNYVCIQGVCGILTDAGIIPKDYYTNTKFAEKAPGMGLGRAMADLKLIRPGDVIQHMSDTNPEGTRFPSHAEIFKDINSAGDYEFYDYFDKFNGLGNIRTYNKEELEDRFNRFKNRDNSGIQAQFFSLDPEELPKTTPLPFPYDLTNKQQEDYFNATHAADTKYYPGEAAQGPIADVDSYKRSSMKHELAGLFNDKKLDEQLRKELKISDQDLQKAKPLIYGIMDQESDFGNPKSLKRDIKYGLKELLGSGSYSMGPAAVRYDDALSSQTKQAFDIDSPHDLSSTKNAYIGALDVLHKGSLYTDNKVSGHPGIQDKDSMERALYWYNNPKNIVNSDAQTFQAISKEANNLFPWQDKQELMRKAYNSPLEMSEGSYPDKVLKQSKGLHQVINFDDMNVLPEVQVKDRRIYNEEPFAMGGSLPGATGSMYARVGAPSKGPHRNQVDVTDASAQNGAEMKYYQEGLDWKPKTISRDGSQLVKLDQLTNFTNYNTKQPGGWLDKYQ
jgi:hypothetical protein